MGEKSQVSSDLEETLGQHRRGSSGVSGVLGLSEQKGYVGDTVVLQGRNFPSNQQFDIVWNSVDGDWGVLEANEIIGAQYRPRQELVTSVTTDDDGTFDEEFTIPEDYGGSHTIEVTTKDGTTVTQAEYDITPWFELEETTAPLGGSFTLKGYGLGPNVLQNNYQVAWDNCYYGFITGVMNRGTATAEIRAVGPPGKHVVQVWRSYRGVPFLQNNTQSPYGPVAGGRTSDWTVEVTEPETPPQQAWVDSQFDETPIETHYPDLDEDTEAALEITPTSGPAGTSAFIRGESFPADTEVDLVWYRHQGHRVRGIPITPEPKPEVLPTVTTDEDGDFQVEVEIPHDVGSTRPITAQVDGRSVAATGFMMQPSIQTFEPTSGPVGTEIEIELSGVGWTTYENAPFFVYDNKPLGYICGVDDDDEAGISRTVLKASGEPGWHFIDAYPSLFRTQDDEPDFELLPHLSYVDNHPVRPLPAFHFAFEITE